MNQFHLDSIRRFEGFVARATWDYKQPTNGFGTRARFVGEVIDQTEAERRFNAEIEEASAAVGRFAPGLDEGTAAALTSLTFNAGTTWMRSGLGAAVKAGDLDRARAIFKEYTLAGGRELDGLVARRQAEAQWFGQGAAGCATAQDSPAAVVERHVLAVSPEAMGVIGPSANPGGAADTTSSGLLAAAGSDPNRWKTSAAFGTLLFDLLAVLARIGVLGDREIQPANAELCTDHPATKMQTWNAT